MKRFLFSLPLFFTVTSMLAQTATPDESPFEAASATPSAAEAVAGGIAALVGGGVCCFVWIGMIAVWLFVAIWIMRDAKNRQSPNATLVTVLGWLAWPIGLIVHLATRPKVNLVPCPNCKKKRPEGSSACPHCGQP
ncbi:MAG: hypothetical protein ABJB09_06225 [Verrucomicrobiota bacterium]